MRENKYLLTRYPGGQVTTVLPLGDGQWVWTAWASANSIKADAGLATSQEAGLADAMSALGLSKPQPAAPPAWMVKVAREANALCCEAEHMPKAAAAYRRGSQDTELVVSRSVAALRLALERGHVVEPREWTEEELLKAAREDAADVVARRGFLDEARAIRAGKQDVLDQVTAALQARRNMLREGGAVAVPTKAPEVDLEVALKEAWSEGYATAISAILNLAHGEGNATTLYANEREKDVAAILANLPTREA